MKIPHIFLIALSLIISFSNCNPKKDKSNEHLAQENEIDLVDAYQLEQVWATEAILKTPESVIHDEERDVLYVSNVNENPWEKDNNGFISKVSTSGKIIELEWVAGFSGPKGMAILNDQLFVADLDEVGIIDIDNGELINKIKIDGASGLNDITPGGSNKLYISDSNEGKLYQYVDGEISIFHDDTPGRPNGLYVDQNKLLVAFSKATVFASYDLNSLEKTILAKEIGSGDGITPTNEKDTYLVSDWQGEVFVINLKGEKKSLLKTKDQEKNTADIWFIKDQNLVLVPTFFDNRVVAYKLIKS